MLCKRHMLNAVQRLRFLLNTCAERASCLALAGKGCVPHVHCIMLKAHAELLTLHVCVKLYSNHITPVHTHRCGARNATLSTRMHSYLQLHKLRTQKRTLPLFSAF